MGMDSVRKAVAGLVVLCALGVPFTFTQAEQPGANPAINLPYRDPDFDTWVARFEQPGREVYDLRQEIVAATGAREGMDVADIGAGTGLFTLLFARKVGAEGRVYAVDIAEKFVENIRRRAQEQGLNNVVGIVNSQADTKLPPQSIDLAFICDAYHYFEKPQEMLRSIRQALRPGGTLVIIDFRRDDGADSSWVKEHVRAGKETVIREVKTAGFELAGEEDFLKRNYFLRFVKQDAATLLQ